MADKFIMKYSFLWTSQYLNADGSQSGSYGVTYHDGMIPQGIFASGTQVTGIDLSLIHILLFLIGE